MRALAIAALCLVFLLPTVEAEPLALDWSQDDPATDGALLPGTEIVNLSSYNGVPEAPGPEHHYWYVRLAATAAATGTYRYDVTWKIGEVQYGAAGVIEWRLGEPAAIEGVPDPDRIGSISWNATEGAVVFDIDYTAEVADYPDAYQEVSEIRATVAPTADCAQCLDEVIGKTGFCWGPCIRPEEVFAPEAPAVEDSQDSAAVAPAAAILALALAVWRRRA